MADPTNFRKERIEKLLYELRYEIERGIMEQDIDDRLGFQFIVPISNSVLNGIVHCDFRTRPMAHYLGMPPSLTHPAVVWSKT